MFRKFVKSISVLLLVVFLFKGNMVVMGQGIKDDEIISVSPMYNSPSRIYWVEHAVLDYGNTKSVTVEQNGYHYHGYLKKTGKKSGWVFVYEGYLYKSGYSPYSYNEVGLVE